MSKTTFTSSGRFLWITGLTALFLISFLRVAHAQDAARSISLESMRSAPKSIPLKLKNNFIPLTKRIPLAQAGNVSAHVGGSSLDAEAIASVGKSSKVIKPHATLPDVQVGGNLHERAKVRV